MNSTSEAPKTAVGTPLPDLELLITALGHSTRWKMLKELTCGEARTIDEMAKVGGVSYDNAAKHLARLHRAGLIVRGRDGFTRSRSNICRRPASPSWISAIACSGWMRG